MTRRSKSIFVIDVAEVLARRSGEQRNPGRVFGSEPKLSPSDHLLAQEVFWDLILDRIITPGCDSSNPNLPFFRVHSEAGPRLKVAK